MKEDEKEKEEAGMRKKIEKKKGKESEGEERKGRSIKEKRKE